MAQIVLDRLTAEFKGGEILQTGSQHGNEWARVRRDAWIKVATFLRDDPATKMEMFIDLTCVDRFSAEPRFEVVYHLYSVAKNHRLRVKVVVGAEAPSVPSVVSLWPSANWMEREVWDLYGIRFRGHPDLRRILLYEEFEGHPLRKDYPKEKRQPLVRRSQTEQGE